jgi:hypothetical protein
MFSCLNPPAMVDLDHDTLGRGDQRGNSSDASTSAVDVRLTRAWLVTVLGRPTRRAGQKTLRPIRFATWPYSPASRSPLSRGSSTCRAPGRAGKRTRRARASSSRTLFELCRERVNALFDQTLDVIEDAMKARQFLVVNRVLVDVGPDHYAQLEAVKMCTMWMRRSQFA